MRSRSRRLCLAALVGVLTPISVIGAMPAGASPSAPASASSALPQRDVGFTGLSSPGGVAVDAAGNPIVSSFPDDSANPARVLKLVGSTQTTLNQDVIGSPWGVAVDAAGNVYFSDFSENKVVKLPAGGGAAVTLGFTGLYNPTGVAVDSTGAVYVADSGNGVVKKLSGTTQTTLAFSGLEEPYGLAVHGTDVYVSDLAADKVLKLAGTTQTEVGFTGLSEPAAVAIDGAGAVYVADAGNNRIVKLLGSTQMVLDFTGLGRPAGVAVSAEGDVYVADTDNDRVVVLPSSDLGNVFVPVTPCRAVDTRVSTPLTNNMTREFQIAGGGAGFAAQGGKTNGCGVPAGAAAVEATVIAVTPSNVGYTFVYPTGGGVPSGTFLNYPKGSTLGNTGAVALGQTVKGLSVKNVSSTTHIVVDVSGYYIKPTTPGSVYIPVSPCRLADTRTSSPIAADVARSFPVKGKCGVPANATAIQGAVTVISPTAVGFTRVYPAGQADPGASFLNYAKGSSLTNSGAMPVADGANGLTIKNFRSSAHFVLDVFGYFVPQADAAGAGNLFVPTTPCRTVDTRKTGMVGVNEVKTFRVTGSGPDFVAQGGTSGGCGIPADAAAVEASVKVVNPMGVGYGRVFATGAPLPGATFLQFKDATVGNTGAVAISNATRGLSLKNFGSRTHYVIDTQGYYVPQS